MDVVGGHRGAPLSPGAAGADQLQPGSASSAATRCAARVPARSALRWLSTHLPSGSPPAVR
ncbi:hypothetical protein I553_10713 [Mycobacterium xenopi 4042]|uniref:Uncharacterized protein n=1 Tax=Mycobacterium xenopi 4042 TaxID=1299334 RepID=X8DBI3_MYCXE|nr:hypothetical protein I553_10713 [Mycobacterium xenopi 4042]